MVSALNQHPIYGAISPIVRLHWCMNQGVEMAMASLTTTANIPLEKVLLSIFKTLGSAHIELLDPKGRIFRQ